ncbi:MAG: hypothetical protein IK085_00825 [Clostridia bacterium]|nr:hypothetical protein [Clostridia bacterium]
MKKTLSLLMAFLMLFSSLCIGANAVEAEQQAEKTQADTERIVLTDKELKEKFGIEQILLPEGFEPVAYVYYDQISAKHLEYITLVFTDGTTVDLTGDEVQFNNLNISWSCLYSNDSESRFAVFLYVYDTERRVTTEFDIDCKTEKQPFSENLKIYSQKISMCILGLIAGQNPGYSERIYFDGNFINDIINGFYRGREELFNRDYFPEDFLSDVFLITKEFTDYYFTLPAPIS